MNHLEGTAVTDVTLVISRSLNPCILSSLFKVKLGQCVSGYRGLPRIKF